jgi:HlyD family secretion protein
MNQKASVELFPAGETQFTGLHQCVEGDMSNDGVAASGDLPLQTVDRSYTPRGTKHQSSGWPWWSAVVIAIAAWLGRDQLNEWLPANSPTFKTDNAKPIIEKVLSLGRLEPDGEVIDVAGPSGSSDARVQSLTVDVGDHVVAGQVLAVLDNHELLQAQQSVAQAQVEQSRMRLKQSRLIAATSYAQLRSSLEASRAQRETALSDLRRQAQLQKSKSSSEQEYEATLLAYATSDKAVAEAEAKLSRYTENEEDSVDVQVAMTDVRVAEASLLQATVVLERSLVRAPNAGRILSIGLRPGERIGQQYLVRMGKTDSMLVRAEVYESDVSKIRSGQSAQIWSLAFNGPLTGVVEKVATLVQRQSIVDSDPAANTDARVVEVLVRIHRDPSDQASHFVGMQVTVEFSL